MKTLKQFVYILIIVLLGCTTNQGTRNVSGNYFDLKRLIDQQILLLDSLQPTLVKKALINNEEATETLKLDSLQWTNELKIFKSADINLPVLEGIYSIKQGDSEPTNNLKVYQYLPSGQEVVKVKYLRIYFVNDSLDFRKIEARVVEDNALFSGSRDFKLEFSENGKGVLYLKKYLIEVRQKMISMDSVYFRIEGVINL